MKNKDVLWFILLLFVSFSCNNDDPTIVEKQEISIPLASQEFATIVGKPQEGADLKYYLLRNRYIDQIIETNENGFEAQVKVDGPSIIELALDLDNRFPLFVSPGDTITLDYDEIDLRNNMLKYDVLGNQSAENKLLMELGGLFGHISRKETYFFNVSESEFLEKLDSLESMANEKLEAFKAGEQQLDHSRIDAMQQFVRAKRAHYLYYYPYCLRTFFAIKDHQESPLYQELKASSINASDEYLNNIAYLDLATTILKQESYKAFEHSNERKEGRRIPSLNIKLSLIDSLFAQKGLRDYLKFRNIGQHFKMLEDYNPQYLEDFEKTKPSMVYVEELKKIESDLLGVFQEDLVIPNYEFRDVDGNVVALDHYRGKLIYIDVWATWCGPCKIQGEYFQQLIEDFDEYKDDIVFLGISIDKKKDVEKWKKEVKDKGLKGVQVIADRTAELSFGKDFKVNAIPRFILIDKDGKIIESHAQSPSQPNMKPYLEKLLAAK